LPPGALAEQALHKIKVGNGRIQTFLDRLLHFLGGIAVVEGRLQFRVKGGDSVFFVFRRAQSKEVSQSCIDIFLQAFKIRVLAITDARHVEHA
jgi:hypothetical protein